MSPTAPARVEVLPESFLREAVDTLVRLVEAAGAVVIVVGALIAAVAFVRALPRRDPDAFVPVRLMLGRFLALGLEFQLAGDVLRTAIAPSFEELGKLAAVAAHPDGAQLLPRPRDPRGTADAGRAGCPDRRGRRHQERRVLMDLPAVLAPVAATMAGGAVLTALLALLTTGSPRAALGILLDLLLAAGLLRLAGADSWTAIASAAAVVAVRKLAVFALRHPARPLPDPARRSQA